MIAAIYYWNSSRIDNSINVLLTQKLVLNYKIENKRKNLSLKSLGGEWKVNVEPSKISEATFSKLLQKADNADLQYYRKRIASIFGVDTKLDNYVLSRAEMPLGSNTICESKNCNIYILWKSGYSPIYVGIF